MSTIELSNISEERAIQDGLNKGEILHFCDLLAPYQNLSIDPSNPNSVFDRARHQANQDLFAFLRNKYGESNVIVSSLNITREGQAIDMPGLLGIYVGALAFEVTHFIENL